MISKYEARRRGEKRLLSRERRKYRRWLSQHALVIAVLRQQKDRARGRVTRASFSGNVAAGLLRDMRNTVLGGLNIRRGGSR